MDAFIEDYLSKGFGKMKLSDLEVLIFHHIITSDEYKGKSVYDLSQKLRLEVSKVKTLKYKEKLAFADDSQQYLDVVELLKNGRKYRDDSCWVISVPDKYCHDYIVATLQSKKLKVNYEQNHENIILDTEAIDELLDDVLSNESFREKIILKMRSVADYLENLAKDKVPDFLITLLANRIG